MPRDLAPTTAVDAPVLAVRGLSISFEASRGRLRAVSDVSFELVRGHTLGLVGESGCGKSVTSLALMGLLPEGSATIDEGEVLFGGRDLTKSTEREMRRLRGDKIAMVFQEPMTSLNPVYTIGWQIVEAIRLHRSVSRRAAHARAIDLLGLVGIPDPKSRVSAYPHELSGGMRQRALIAMALACEPEVLIADEPTTALDVTIQAQILDLLRRLQGKMGMGILLITHDLGVVAQFARDVVVMYAGRIVEACTARDLFERPAHPYSLGLLGSTPPVGLARGVAGRPKRLPTIEGSVPSLASPPPGCRFEPRCAFRQAVCRESEPPLRQITPNRRSRCFFAEEVLRHDRQRDA